MQECCCDLGVADRVGDLMQQKLYDYQAAKVAREKGVPSPVASSAASSPRGRRSSLEVKSEEGFICGSPTFQEYAAFRSSHQGQVLRSNFHRKNMFEAEEAIYRERFDIFGNPKCSSPAQSPTASEANGDMIDRLISSTETPSHHGSGRNDQIGAYQDPVTVRANPNLSPRSYGTMTISIIESHCISTSHVSSGFATH